MSRHPRHRRSAALPPPPAWRRPMALAMQLLVTGGILAGAGGPARAQDAPASVPASPADPATLRRYDIPAGPLGTVLMRFLSESGVLLSGSAALTEGRSSPGVQGRYAPAAGLAALLAGTGLEAMPDAQGRYLLRPAAAATQQTEPSAENTLTPVKVTAQAEGLPAPFAGGQVARGGRLGMLGNADLMDTPFNITNYTSQLLEDQQAETVLDVLKNEPSVRQTAPTGSLADSSFNIRGFSLSAGAVTFDGLHGMAPNTGNLSAEFAERVEVLKGPSALLYGMSPSGTVGGAVNLVPKRAGDTPLTRVTLGLESKALWKAQVDTGRRFGAHNEWGLRFNGRYKDGDRFIEGARNEGHLGALALDYRGERLRLTLDAYRLQERQHGGGTPFISLDSGLTSMPAAPDGRTSLFPGAPESRETTEAVILGGELDFNDRWTGYAKLGMQHSKFEGPVNAWAQNVQANGDAVLSPDDWPSFARTRSGEIGLRGRFQTGPVSHALAFSASYLNRDSGGAYAYGTSQPTNLYDPAPIRRWAVSPTHVPKTSETTLSGFALADTLGFMEDRVLLTLGVRRQHVKATNFDDTSGAVTSGYDASAWTPMAGVVVRPGDDLSLYANVIQGLSQGTTVGGTYQNAGEVFPPYKTKQIEVGAKLQTGSFTNTVSVFQIAKPSTVADNSTTPLPTLRLDGEQRNRGIEWSVFGELTRGLRMLGGVTYTQAKLTKTQGGLQDGNQAPGTPPWAVNLGLDWDVPGLPGLAVNGRVVHTSAQVVNNANSFKMPSWTLPDVGARYATRLGGKPVVFRASVDNLFDRHYWQGVWYSDSVAIGEPRTFRLSATVDF